MFKKTGVIFILFLMLTSFAYAGKVELTTYYPAPYGEYSELKTTGNTSLATAAGMNVGVGTLAPQATLDVARDGGAIIVPRKSDAGDPSGVEGMIYYNAVDKRFRVYEDGAWKNLSGGGSGFGPQTGMANNHVYRAAADGFVTVFAAFVGGPIEGFTDSSANPTTLVAVNHAIPGSIMFPVKKNNYWKVCVWGTSGGETIRITWTPME